MPSPVKRGSPTIIGRIEALPSQERFFTEPRTRFKGFSGPVGSGKTYALADMAIALAHANRGRTGLLGAPTYPMLRDATLVALEDRLAHHGVKYRMNRSEMRMTILSCNSRILFRPVEHFDRLRGQNLAWFGVDELTYCPEFAWMQLEARLRDPKAPRLCGYGVWTPKGFDWVYRRFIGPEKLQDYAAIQARPFENGHLPPGFYENLERSYANAFARQEVYGEYLNVFSGRAYQQFDRALNVFPARDKTGASAPVHAKFADCRFNRHRPLLWALDFNINPNCSVIAQTVPRPTSMAEKLGSRGFARPLAFSDVAGSHAHNIQLNVLDEIFMNDSTTDQVCAEFLARAERIRKTYDMSKLMVFVYGDQTGENRDTASHRTDWQLVQDFFARNKNTFDVSFKIRTRNPAVKDRVNAVNAMCSNATGDRRMLVHENCKELIKDLEEVAWKKQQKTGIITAELDQKTNPMRTHLSDALGYLIDMEFGLLGKSGERAGYVA